MRILQNQVKCNKCGDTPFSAYRWDFASCKCGAVAVDGGLSYLRRVGNLGDITELSITASESTVDKCEEAIRWAIDTDRNELGILCAVLRTLRDCGYNLDPPEEK